MKTINRIVTHNRPHLDEIVAIFLLLLRWPKAVVSCIENQTDKKIKLDADTIAIGIGGGQFDEHASGKDGRKEGECAATLVAKWLGTSDDPALEKLLKYTLRVDLKGSNEGIMSIDRRIKSMYEHMGEEDVIKWALVLIGDIYQEQKKFFGSLLEKATHSEIEFHGKKVKVALLAGNDDPVASKVALHQGIGLFIQGGPSGSVQIFSDKKLGLPMGDLARVLRIEEYHPKALPVKMTWKELETAEKIEGLPEWYFHPGGGFILNGSKTAVAPPTKLSLAKIRSLAEEVFSDKAGYRKCQPVQVGACAKCNHYPKGFRYCRSQRAELKAEGVRAKENAAATITSLEKEAETEATAGTAVS